LDAAKTLPPLQMARKAGLGVIGMKVLAGSFRLDPATYDRARAIMKRSGAGLAALKWALNGGVVDVAIPGMIDMDQLEENMRAMSEPFGNADGQMLASYIERYGPLYCRMCGLCEGACTKGLPVSDVQRVLAYADGYRQFPLARERYLRLAGDAGLERCDCSACAVKCAFGVNVAARVRRAQQLLA
jgi:predicted aldo/keto reductase-like oxidoreductase